LKDANTCTCADDKARFALRDVLVRLVDLTVCAILPLRHST
jgi:hypothetical protein